MLRLGLISDTHDRPHPRVFTLFDGVDRILHAGDICTDAVLVELSALAPVIAVHGNCCSWALRDRLPECTMTTIGAWRIFLQHDIGKPGVFRPRLEAQFPGPAAPHVVVSGHSHRHGWEQVGSTWFVNPGSAGPARFKSRPTAAILTLDEGPAPRVEFVALET